MPHINRIRVNNVKYNFGTQFYDNFIMRFEGRNALYDLANGGGKSVLMLLLFQNLIPNCTLDDKQPVEKLFRTGNGSTTIHSLIEWNLDERDIADGYKYMLTGFCARKAKDDGSREKKRDVASIDYFNYVIFYREYNDNDIINLPLQKDGTRITYTGLRTLLKDLGHSDRSLKVFIFDHKGEYQRFISRYGLYESAWEIVRGINKTEGHVRAWFETHYRTTRKVVEDLLIEEIIQKAFFARSADGDEPDMAKTLLDIKDQLMELSRKKEEISIFQRQTDALEAFLGRIDTLDQLYEQEQSFASDLVKTYNTAAHVLRQKEKALALSEKEKENLTVKSRDIGKKLDSAKILQTRQNLAAFEKDEDKYDALRSELSKNRKEKQQALDLRQSVNDYLEYVDIKKKADRESKVIESVSEDSGGLIGQLHCLAARQKRLFDKNKLLWEKNIVELEKELKADSDLRAQVQERENAGQRGLAVAQNEILRAKADQNRIQDEISRLRSNINSLLLEGSERKLRNNRIELRNVIQEMEKAQEQISGAKEEIHKAMLGREALKVRMEQQKKAEEDFSQFQQQWTRKKAKAEKLLEIYKADDFYHLEELIYGRWQKSVVDADKKQEELGHIQKVYDQLDTLEPMAPGAEFYNVLDALRRLGVTCIPGSDYLGGLEIKDRREVLERFPYLPCAVVVQNGFSKLAKDPDLALEISDEDLYPIIALDKILGNDEIDKTDRILFLTKNKVLFYDKDAAAKEKQRLEERLDQCRKALERQKDTIATYKGDMEYIHEFIINHLENYDRMARLLEEGRQSQSGWEARDHSLEETIREAKELSKRSGTRLEELKKEKADLEQEGQALEAIEKLEKEMDDARQRLEDNEAKVQEYTHCIALEKNEGARLREKILKSRGQMDQLKARLTGQEKDWKDIYLPYFSREESFTEEVLPQAETEDDLKAKEDAAEDAGADFESCDAVEAAFLGIREAFEKEHTDLEDKQRLLESYQQTMGRIRDLIARRETPWQTLEEMYSKGAMFVSSDDELRQLKEEIAAIDEEIDSNRRQSAAARDHKNRLEGHVENAIAAVEEKYGSFEPVKVTGGDYARFITEQQKLLEQVREKLELVREAGLMLAKERQAAEDVKKDLDRLMRTAHVTYNLTRDFYADGRELRKRYDRLNEDYERLKKDEIHKREAFEKNRDQLADLLRELKAPELSDEIRYHMELPGDSRQAGELSGHIREIIRIIQLEKGRVGQGIRDMAQIKESFENQCLQRCIDIKTQLERLSGLSKIILDGRQVPMIQLKIPYVKEEFYSSQMSDYIDTIVSNADSYRDLDEKLKYIRQKLSWKNLFSVIVTDMNGIRLDLYKRERIHQQSRYLRYEEAVGSTGQSQGIYIQFLIAVINYISAIYSGDSQPSEGKKVIFIDNPFGAAKDIYIWEPIFELLKANHVQMIVPARGATPAISGMFDVNYVLGQKMIDGQVQTVVVDYYSKVPEETKEYVKIDFEQQVFDFI